MTINIKTYDRTFGELSRNETITGNDIYTYLCLTPFINSNCTYLPINVAELNSILSDVANNKKQKDCIKIGLQKLEQADLIEIISNSNNKYDYELDLDNMVEPYDKKNPYTVFPVDSFRQTLKDCHNKKTIFKFLSGYFYELTHNEMSADGSELYYFMATREELAERCGIDVRSLDKYLYILQKNKIIYVYKYNYKYRDSGKQLPNAYGLYKNKDIIDSKCNDYLNEHKDDNKPTYTKESKFFVCKTPRLCVYLQKKGFMFDIVTIDKKNPLFNVWLFPNSDELYDIVEDYFATQKYNKF